ncbi:permease [Niallia sp. FSL R7-0271]|uniref:permease n=1 Tax=Niallia sp. FSL R7-0271 TaxID=2921678 RepID=UPI0030F9918C
MSIPTSIKDFIVFALFLFLMYLFFFGDVSTLPVVQQLLTDDVQSIFIVFLAIFLEALPFLLLGAIASSVINIYVSEAMIAKIIPKNPIAAIFVGVLAACITPVCECAIIPVVRRLIQKGVPVHVGVVLLMCAPILNFIVFGSTFYAFRLNMPIVYGRFIVCIVAAVIVGFIMHAYFSKKNVLKMHKEDLVGNVPVNVNKGDSRWKGILHHTCFEFFAVAKYFIIGALFAAIAQVYLQETLYGLAGENVFKGTAVMMALAYILSLCSEADAFVAVSFTKTFQPEAILGFLVFGPILDFKNTLVMLASFKFKFVAVFIFVVSVIVFALSIIAGHFM